MNRNTREKLERRELREQAEEIADVVPVNRMIHTRDVKRRKIKRKP